MHICFRKNFFYVVVPGRPQIMVYRELHTIYTCHICFRKFFLCIRAYGRPQIMVYRELHTKYTCHNTHV